MPASAPFSALHIERSGRFLLESPLARVAPCFTPEGERAWAPGWDPEYLHPSDGALGPGLVFRTRIDGEETVWMALRADFAAGEFEYARLTPGSRVGTVSVRCAERSAGVTEVTVVYRMTGLSPEGNARLAALDEAAYAEFLEEWRTAILAGWSAAS